MHIVAYLHRGIEDTALAALWTQHDLYVRPLSSWYTQTQKRYGLVIGYTNIRSTEEAQKILLRVRAKTLALMQH
jgi:GntR family transcriptional regulator/MocR family aminotransferase